MYGHHKNFQETQLGTQVILLLLIGVYLNQFLTALQHSCAASAPGDYCLEQMPAPTTLPRLWYGHHPWSHSECGNDSTVPTRYLDGHTDTEEETGLLLYMLSQQRYLHAYPKKFPTCTFKLSVAYLYCYFKMSKKLWIIPLRATTHGWAGYGLYKGTWPTEAVSIQRKGAFQILHRGSVCPRSSHACIIFTALT